MSEDRPEVVIPFDRLPPGFAERLDAPETAAEAKPAATAVLVRDSDEGPEILLLKRIRSAGFVPGAWVFPGGRVDAADEDERVAARMPFVPRGAPASYWAAAIREVFEETGVLLVLGDVDIAQLPDWRERLLSHEAALHDILDVLELTPDLSRMVYCSHWITPVAEPKRFDTRFFLAQLPDGAEVQIDPREMSDAVWLTARAAIEQFRAGSLPMVFPTVKTIQMLQPYRSVHDMLAAFRYSEVPAVLPRLVRTQDGVGIVMPDE